MSIQVFVIRHGATAWNKEKRLQGKQDLPLSTEGIEQLKGCQIPDQFIDLDWYCSPLQRARQTAQLLEID
ncbi:MAG: histidine phosphatase family protein, partial [Motiliproteus sp.]|nr:histidine phosphatase family protein [Motiliproteus sp.]